MPHSGLARAAASGGALLAALLPAVLAPAPVAADAAFTPADIDAYMTAALADGGLPGAVVAVTRGTEVVHAAGYGHDSEGAALAPDSPMAVGSLSKSVTALAVAQLADEGLLAFDDPVRRHLPEFAPADPGFSRRARRWTTS
ncbi:beta-lactamase family protein [Streptomonospora sp. NEAU-YY374]|uniref:CubicO group peptidase (Beta-lactamase class C family) n=2 Tax=Streptomonospora nanhaiensis TaxID=1323731 RepID=A0A853BM71_9ACTN|nr:beta-lactamase family protein [Streptomonospora nanhaiensis]NYI95784.1 CubicO group peptidase (beta-lactamase class C family) [Streptomonospora nanhaiensis]